LLAEPTEFRCVLRVGNHDRRPLAVDLSLEYVKGHSGVTLLIDGEYADHSDAFSNNDGAVTEIQPGVTIYQNLYVARLPLPIGVHTVQIVYDPNAFGDRGEAYDWPVVDEVYKSNAVRIEISP
jgi:hypothetical protein